MFNLILEIEKQPMSLANEQRAQALTDTVKSWIEGRRIPDVFVHPVISSVVGMLHIRFSRLWGPVTQALGVAALKHPEAGSKPIYHQHVCAVFLPVIQLELFVGRLEVALSGNRVIPDCTLGWKTEAFQ